MGGRQFEAGVGGLNTKSKSFLSLITIFDQLILFRRKQTGDPCQSFSPWPAPQAVGVEGVIPCTYLVEVFDGGGAEIFNTISSAIKRMKGRSVLAVDMN